MQLTGFLKTMDSGAQKPASEFQHEGRGGEGADSAQERPQGFLSAARANVGSRGRERGAALDTAHGHRVHPSEVAQVQKHHGQIPLGISQNLGV